MRQYLRERIESCLSSLGIPFDSRPTFEQPRNPAHGDLTSNIALVSAKRAGMKPRDLALRLVEKIGIDPALVDRVEVAGPGFINFRFADAFYHRQIAGIISRGGAYGRVDIGRRTKTQVEFVSANPTGPLTVGHGRGAVYGDTVARLLEWAGYDVTREYYFNNAGRQMRILADSVRLRYLELLGEKVAFPEDYYQGEYIRDIARHVLDASGRGLTGERLEAECRKRAEEEIFEDIKATLKRIGIAFDVFFNENSLYESGAITGIVEELRAKELAYEKDGAVWFRAASFGGQEDKVIVKSSGEPTYRLPDIAYHREKFRRGFELVIDVLGADHIATYPDVLAGLRALGLDADRVKVLIHQFVTIVQGGEVVKMSTRKANFITLDELIDETGADVVRYFFLMRGIGSHLNFDLELAREQSDRNPVYYLQYAHARIASIVRHAKEAGAGLQGPPDLSLLTMPEEMEIARRLVVFPDLVESAASSFEPHRIAEYLLEVAGSFHAFYHRHRVVTPDAPLTAARLALCSATQTVLANGFSILGVAAPERM